MQANCLVRIGIAVAASGFIGSLARAADPRAVAAKQILQAKCFSCHGANPEAIKGNLNILDHDGLLDPGKKIVIPGDADGSELIRRVAKGQMPKGKPPLSEAEQATLRTWIAAGAPGLDDNTSAPSGPPTKVAEFPPDLPPAESLPTAPRLPNVTTGQNAEFPPDLPPAESLPAAPRLPNVTTGQKTGSGAQPWVPDTNIGLPSGPLPLAARVQLIFTQRCFKCHGEKEKEIEGEIKILDRELLVAKKKVVPGSVNESTLFKLITAKKGSMMPPEEFPRLTDEQISDVRAWIAAGAPAVDAAQFAEQAPEGVPDEKPIVGRLGNEYTLQSILNDVRKLKQEDRRYVRYFSLTHILDGGATREELTQQRQAFFKALNHLTWASQIVIPRAVEPTYTVFRVDLRALGWDKLVYSKAGAAYADFTLFDLALLEYPYGVIHDSSDAYLGLVREYFPYAKSVRPIAFLRTDWFCSVCTLPPLYHDFLQLPQTVEQLETVLAVDAKYNIDNFRAQRSGMTDSQVSRNNRVVERHPGRFGCYWKSYDFKSSSEQENMLKDPINLHQTGGEMVFSLPNGLHGYYVANSTGQRIDAAPTEIVVDKNASDRIVRNGLSCMRCHNDGVKTFNDAVRPTVQRLAGQPGFSLKRVLNLYPEQAVMNKLLETDTKKFLTSMERALGRAQLVEPLIPVTTRFMDKPLNLPLASAEAGLAEPKNLKDIFRLPQFANLGLSPLGVDRTVHRDTWQSYYDRVIRQLGLGVAIVPLDGLNDLDYEPSFPAPFQVTCKTGKSGNQYSPGEKLALTITADRDVYIEVIATSHTGVKLIWVPSSTKLSAGEEYRYPPKGQSLLMRSVPGKMQITVYASAAAFPAGEILRADGVADRIVHPFHMYQRQGKKFEITFSPDPLKTVKKTLELEIK